MRSSRARTRASRPATLVVGQLGWQDYAVARGGSLRKLDPALAPPQTALHVLGATGLTAYFGLFDVGEAKPGDAVVVSAASGAVGQIVGQLAKIAGCGPVVGLAGTPEKVADLTELYGYDVGIDYKRDDVNARAEGGVPERRRRLLRQRRRRALGDDLPPARPRRARAGLRADLAVQPRRAGARATQPRLPDRLPRPARGLPDHDYVHRFPEGLRASAAGSPRASCTYREDVTEGLENAPAAFIGMLRGENRGKTLVKHPLATGRRRYRSISAFAGACATSPLAGSPATSSGSRPSRPVDGIAERPLLLNIA